MAQQVSIPKNPDELDAAKAGILQDPKQLQVLLAAVKGDIQRAREDEAFFFEFVVRTHTTGARMKIAPHQKLGLEFIRDNPRCVFMWPVNSGKTQLLVAHILFTLGHDPTARIAIVSATEGQAEKILQVVRDAIESNPALRLVFPELVQGRAKGDKWTQTAITIKRPPGIKEPSVSVYGIDSGIITGSRFSLVIIDDILNMENTSTKDQRDKVKTWVSSSVEDRLDRRNSRIIVSNVPWHPDDFVCWISRPTNKGGLGWATLRVDVLGDIEIRDDEMRIRAGVPIWDSDLIRPKFEGSDLCRLVAHDPDPDNQIVLWPEEITPQVIEGYRLKTIHTEFNRKYLTIVRDDDTAMCKMEYVDRCKKKAHELGIYSLMSKYDGPNFTFTGVDLAFGQGQEHDDTAIVTIGVWPGGVNVLLDVEVGKWPTVEVFQRVLRVQKRYNSTVRVENNGAQKMMIDFLLRENASFPVKAHTTTAAKAHPEMGIPSMFLEMANGAWAFPCSMRGEVHPHVQRLIDACIYYTPQKHTDDVMMGWYFAREQRRAWLGALGDGRDTGDGAGIAASIMAR